MRALLLAAALAMTTVSANALTPLQASVAQELRHYGFKDVDVTQLSNSKLLHIKHLLHSNKSVSQIRGNIGAVLGDSLIRHLFN